MDQAPGPIIANVPPNDRQHEWTSRYHSHPRGQSRARRLRPVLPTKGVHSPAKMNNPSTAPVISGIIRPAAGSLELRYRVMEQCNPCDQPLNEKPEPRPAIREC